MIAWLLSGATAGLAGWVHWLQCKNHWLRENRDDWIEAHDELVVDLERAETRCDEAVELAWSATKAAEAASRRAVAEVEARARHGVARRN